MNCGLKSELKNKIWAQSANSLQTAINFIQQLAFAIHFAHDSTHSIQVPLCCTYNNDIFWDQRSRLILSQRLKDLYSLQMLQVVILN